MYSLLTIYLTGAAVPLAYISSEDSLTVAYRAYLAWCNSLSNATATFLMRGLVLLLIPTLICSVTFFYLRIRSVAIQWAGLLVGLFVAFEIPLNFLDGPSLPRAWIITFSLFALAVLPGLLAWLLNPTMGGRRRLTAAGYVLLAIAFLVNLIRR